MKVGILGSAAVARTLGSGFRKHGDDVMLGSRDPAALQEWAAGHPGVRLGDLPETASFADIVVLAVNGRAALAALRLAGRENLRGKIVIDTTNPIADAPPANGVIRFFTDLDRSLLEQLQDEVPEARFVKAFNSVGNQHMVDPQFPGGPPTMFICGNDPDAKRTVTGILERFGWEAADMGAVEAARAIEPLCILWCIPGLLRGEWGHTFKLLSR
jgi:8-hydroxy-5-deazaflavin:NADPH oxidoreductase